MFKPQWGHSNEGQKAQTVNAEFPFIKTVKTHNQIDRQELPRRNIAR
jgi:hypothetical protein